MRRRKYRRASVNGFGLPKKLTTDHAIGAGLAIAGEALVDYAGGGVLTDDTGRVVKMVGGGALLLLTTNGKLQGAGLGLLVNNAYAKFVSQDNKTLGDEVMSALNIAPAPPAAAGLRGYPYTVLPNGSSNGQRRVVRQ